MQYFRPGGIYFAGDTMPFFHDNCFHLFYLLDEEHHKALNGLGGHQWAHATSPNLVDWEHHLFALAITTADEGSICTGSVYYHAGTYYAYYATRHLAGDAACICLDAAAGLAIGGLGGLPANVRITLQVLPTSGAASFGLWLRAALL